jgi:hypothetical protein
MASLFFQELMSEINFIEVSFLLASYFNNPQETLFVPCKSNVQALQPITLFPNLEF